MNKKDTIVVMGSNCFSASNMIDLLLENGHAHVIGFSRSAESDPLFLPYTFRSSSSFQFFQADMVKDRTLVFKMLDELKPRYIINYSALSEVFYSVRHPLDYYHINTDAVVALCEHLRKQNYCERYVHISSAEVYGTCHKRVDETQPENPTTPYAISKAAADRHLFALKKHHQFPMNIVRSTNVYGKHQQLFKIIPRSIINLKMGKKIILHGGGTVHRNFIHIHDVSKGILEILKKGKIGEMYHFSTEDRKSIAEVVKTICSMMGFDFVSSIEMSHERSGQDEGYLLDTQKSFRDLAWKPGRSFENGVKEVISWIEMNWDTIFRQPLTYVHRV